ncbi:hypothetical protein glysoja_035022 [Glycine soja]|uniref:Uncharacterized protein n=1 Tax=Glycine soja TaxID=3848 RepID=A0A0B2SKN1_GLYSO|nr:hypothetical protein glysoja_035022 [Glycine soja]
MPTLHKFKFLARHKLKDLFVSSPPPPPLKDEKTIFHHQQQQQQQQQDQHEEFLPNSAVSVRFRAGSPLPASALRPVSSVFRYRLLRRAWRPVLVTIPE